MWKLSKSKEIWHEVDMCKTHSTQIYIKNVTNCCDKILFNKQKIWNDFNTERLCTCDDHQETSCIITDKIVTSACQRKTVSFQNALDFSYFYGIQKFCSVFYASFYTILLHLSSISLCFYLFKTIFLLVCPSKI